MPNDPHLDHRHHHHHHGYVHAMGHAALTPIYDPFMRLIARERTFKGGLVERLGLHAGDRVLDVGCGTGTLVAMIRQRYPGAQVTGVDGDPTILERARRKAADAGIDASFHTALAGALPFSDGAFEHVTSTLMAHHLTTEEKAQMFAEVRRVLAPGGVFHLVDIGPARSRVGGALQRLGLGGDASRRGDNVHGRLPAMMTAAGFADVREEHRVLTVFGPFVYWRGVRPRT